MVIQMAGIRNLEDALMCVDCGVDIIGLLVGQQHNGDDFISKEVAKHIKDNLPKEIKTTLITHLESAERIIDLVKYIDVDYIQLHSYISESEVEKIATKFPDKKLFRLVHIDNNGTLLNDISTMKYVDYYFTDSINKETNQFGGTGLTHAFKTDAKLVKTLNKPVIIAGGLTPENVGQIIKECKPYGVDVNTGCKNELGFRDKNKVLKFVQNVKDIK